MRILGISCFYHDAAACVVEDGVIIAAAQEERFTRIKHDASFPEQAIRYCLDEAGGSDISSTSVYFRLISCWPGPHSPLLNSTGTDDASR